MKSDPAGEFELETAGTASGPAQPPGADPSAQGLSELRAKALKADDHWERLLRLSADFENFKKRANRDRQEAIRFANENILERLIPVLDNLEAALGAAQAHQEGSADSLKAGITMICNQLRGVLQEAGLEEIDAALQPFDPNWHEAISEQESSEVREGHVLQQMRKGYKLRERLLRPAKVIVAKAPTVSK